MINNFGLTPLQFNCLYFIPPLLVSYVMMYKDRKKGLTLEHFCCSVVSVAMGPIIPLLLLGCFFLFVVFCILGGLQCIVEAGAEKVSKLFSSGKMLVEPIFNSPIVEITQTHINFLTITLPRIEPVPTSSFSTTRFMTYGEKEELVKRLENRGFTTNEDLHNTLCGYMTELNILPGHDVCYSPAYYTTILPANTDATMLPANTDATTMTLDELQLAAIAITQERAERLEQATEAYADFKPSTFFNDYSPLPKEDKPKKIKTRVLHFDEDNSNR